MNLRQRFESKVDRSGGPDACHPWTAGVRSLAAPYGSFWMAGKAELAHRVAFFLAHGRWPLVGMHDCDNKLCCNTAHIQDGTHQKNAADAVARGLKVGFPRLKTAARRWHKLSNRQVVELICNKGLLTTRQLGRVYGVTQSLVCKVQNGVA